MSQGTEPSPRERAADVWLELELEEELGNVTQPDLRHRVLASAPERRAQAAQQVAPERRGARLLAAAIVLVGVATVIAVFQSVGDERDKPDNHQLTPDPDTPNPGPEQQDPQPKPTPTPKPREVLAKTQVQFQRHAAATTRISITAGPIGPNSWQEAMERNRTPLSAEATATMRQELQTLQPLQPAGWKWQNTIRLERDDGTFMTCSLYRFSESRIGIRGLGDFLITDKLRQLLVPIIEEVAMQTRLSTGSVRGPEDLRRRGRVAVPPDIQHLSCGGLRDDDLPLLMQFKKLESLDLSSSNVGGKGLAHLLPIKLDTLRMRYSPVSDKDLTELGAHQTLRHLDVSNHTELTGKFLYTFAASDRLQTLKIGWGNTLTDDAMRAIATMKSLTELDLSGRSAGKLTTSGLQMLGKARSLRVLRVDNLPVSMDELFASLGALPDLREVRATFTNVSNVGLLSMSARHAADFPQTAPPLRKLDLTGCKELQPGVTRVLGDFLQLEELKLARSSLAVVDENGKPTVNSFQDLQRLQKLTTLTLNGLRLNATACKHIARLPSLRHLDLSFNGDGIDDEAVGHLAEAKGLVHLELAGCDNVTDEGMRALSKMTWLTYLGLNTCDGFTAAGLDAFRKANPDCELRLPAQLR